MNLFIDLRSARLRSLGATQAAPLNAASRFAPLGVLNFLQRPTGRRARLRALAEAFAFKRTAGSDIK